MSSIVGDIISFIEASIELVVPTISKSKNYYDFVSNGDNKNNHIYAVRPGSASSSVGVTRYSTITQEFEVQLARDYFDHPADDVKLRAAVELINIDAEAILKELSLRKNLCILIVQPPSFGAPDIDAKNKVVSITFTYPITYRKSIKGVP